MNLRYLFYLLAVAGGVVATIFFIAANGSDTEWGLASGAISWTLFLLITGFGRLVVPTNVQQNESLG